MPRNRRTFIATLGAAAIGVLSTGRLSARQGPHTAAVAAGEPGALARTRARASVGTVAGAARALEYRGVQLYTVRRLMAQDMAATLDRVAAIGYREVEFAGYFQHTAAQVRDLLAGSGLAAPSAHVPFDALGDSWPRVLDEALAVGHQYVTVPSLPARVRGSLDAWKRTAGTFNQAAAVAREAGLGFAYHNHDFELAVVDDVVPLDVLITATDPALVSFQLDLYWVTRAGHDPMAWLRRYPGRFSMLHLKDSGGPPEHRMLDVGAGVIDFAGILAHAADSGVRHGFVEHDAPADALASIGSSFEYLSRLGT
jgi:sugar phosphate isomerase/epimerase